MKHKGEGGPDKCCCSSYYSLLFMFPEDRSPLNQRIPLYPSDARLGCHIFYFSGCLSVLGLP